MTKVVVVDGFSSGKYVARRLSERGCVLMHVASSGSLDSYYYKGLDHSLYDQLIVNADFTTTLASVMRFAPQFIIAGAETGVLLADHLNEQMQLPYRNDFDQTNARRNKYDMIQCVTHAQLPAARQFIANTWDLAHNWIKSHGCFPVVIKPLESAGADGVSICEDMEACEAAVKTLLGTMNRLSIANTQVLIQEYLAGSEYVVNMVSLDGQQLVTEVVRYQKQRTQRGGVLYDIDELIGPDSAVYPILVDYTRAVVRCLGIRNGPSHAEVMFTDDGPKLVEVAARTDGILLPEVSRKTTGLGQIDATVLSITEPEVFAQLLAKDTDYRLLQHTYNVCLINRFEGCFNKGRFLSELLKLESFFDAVFYVENGQQIGATEDVFSQPGTVYLVHADPTVIAADYHRIRLLESQGAYLTVS
ncbi:ATP-grasp domain-containing protein [Pseudomonas gessardii]|uniref:ATP-grasp domain-containing protein n=3 Tax=Pseudomonas gessardii TaxID=78544 RepID=A0ABS9FDS3_9PSED|nr:ATP-grasp domain-containing protein [Pseudomonas gessardii]MCF4990229.1 ATP-grasp domain-containing protein [Pseudomonas gessardii]MCF5088195.1 ATP-grasp domain-containing protein [Pseudomonas gessardii]MCF5110487.1 ATP-grasp domain-containing protein [Pseudomonas gessardii]NNA92221.1 ATP-grasp domain-containing protein [Pseudomonas gessardii]